MERRTWNGAIGDSVMAHSPTWLKFMAVLAFGRHLVTGRAFEPRTVVAMALRNAIRILPAIGAHRALDSGRDEPRSARS